MIHLSRSLSVLALTAGFAAVNPAAFAEDSKPVGGDAVTLEFKEARVNDPRLENVPPKLSVGVTTNEMADKPITPFLGGFLFEMGYGDMEGPMWAEMFFNRKFERFPPYNVDRNFWYQVEDQGRNNLEPDWTKKSWYHDGYEHNAWFAAPGSEGPFCVTPETTFLVAKSALAEVLIQPMTPAGSGNRFLRISNHEATQSAGLGQQGKYLREGMRYDFRGRFRRVLGNGTAELLMFPEGKWDKPLVRLPIKDLGSEFSGRKLSFKVKNFTGRATFALFIPPGAVVDVDDFSLMPADNVKGWRKDVVAAMREFKPGALRWPGGCFASFYGWQHGVGDRDARVPGVSPMWGGWVYNDVGTLEYLELCELTGAEPFISVNMFDPDKERYYYYDPVDKIFAKHFWGYTYPQFTDIEQGAKLAADWVAYCNAPVGTHPMADLRARHGHPKPFKVKYWELDNELFRWFNSPEELARAAILYSRAMHAVDPGIKTGLCTYGNRLSDGTAKMLGMAGQDIGFLADRGPFAGNTDHKVGLIRNYNAKHGTSIQYADTEFFVVPDRYSDSLIRQFQKDRNERNLDHATWAYGLNTANLLMLWQRYGGDVAFSCFNSFVNDHLHSPFDTPKDRVLIKYPGDVYGLINRSPARWPLILDGYRADAAQPFQVQAAWDAKRKKLVLYVYNATPQTRQAGFDLRAVDTRFKRGEMQMLSAPDMLQVNTVKEPHPVTRSAAKVRVNPDEAFIVNAEPFSFTEVVLE